MIISHYVELSRQNSWPNEFQSSSESTRQVDEMIEQISEDSVINEFLKSIGPWSNYIVIGGGYALIIYRLYLANNNGISPAGTRDIDTLISRKVPKIFGKSIAECLKEAGFAHSFKDYDNPATESYIKEINGIEVEVEFLTDDSTRKGKDKNIIH